MLQFFEQLLFGTLCSITSAMVAGNVLDLWKRLNGPTELIAVDEQPNHNVMQPGRFRETNRFTS
jgi:hypothetical protein